MLIEQATSRRGARSALSTAWWRQPRRGRPGGRDDPRSFVYGLGWRLLAFLVPAVVCVATPAVAYLMLIPDDRHQGPPAVPRPFPEVRVLAPWMAATIVALFILIAIPRLASCST